MNTKTIMAFNTDDSTFNKSLAPLSKEEPVIIFFQTKNTSEILPDVISDYYNLGVNTWPTMAWVNNQLNYFIEHSLKPRNLYKPKHTTVLLSRLLSNREKLLNNNKYNSVIIDAISL